MMDGIARFQMYNFVTGEMVETKPVDEMSADELSEFLQQNPAVQGLYRTYIKMGLIPAYAYVNAALILTGHEPMFALPEAK